MRHCAVPVHEPREFRRHEPEKTVLYQVVSEHLNTFLESAEARAGEGRGLPRYVRNAFRNYLECGILAFCQERLRRLTDGRVVYQLRNTWPDGSTHLVLEPVEFLGKLAALACPP